VQRKRPRETARISWIFRAVVHFLVVVIAFPEERAVAVFEAEKVVLAVRVVLLSPVDLRVVGVSGYLVTEIFTEKPSLVAVYVPTEVYVCVAWPTVPLLRTGPSDPSP